MTLPLLETDPDDRILILGASGWFGQTFRTLLPSTANTLLVAGSGRGPFITWDGARIEKFRPTMVVNFSFLTKRRASEMSTSEFSKVNLAMTSRFLEASRLESVQKVLTVSSGAAVTDSESPYGALKAQEEAATLELRDLDKRVAILRAYSVSGDLIRHPRAYAFSDFVLQALEGHIKVVASRPVYRRYVGIADALRVLWANLLLGETEILETGGELVEMRELATAIARQINPSAGVSWPEWTSEGRDDYFSDNLSWSRSVARSDVIPLDLSAQIEKVADYLRNAHSEQ